MKKPSFYESFINISYNLHHDRNKILQTDEIVISLINE